MKPSIKKNSETAPSLIPQEAKPSFGQALNSRATMVGPVLEGILEIGKNISGINFAHPTNYNRI